MELYIEHDPTNSPKRVTHSQRSRNIMLQLRSDPAFMESLMAGIRNPERAKKSSDSFRANEEAMARRRTDVLRFQDEKPLPKALKGILALPVEKQNYLIAQTYKQLVSDPTRKDVAEFVTQGKTPKEFGPLIQGFLLMAHAYDELQSPVSPQASTMQTVHNTINKPKAQRAILSSLTKRKRVLHFANELASMRFPLPTSENSSTFVPQAVVTQRETDRYHFLFGAALAYNLHLRMETMRCKNVSRRNVST